MKNVIVTGSSGYIGAHLMQHFKEDGIKSYGIDRTGGEFFQQTHRIADLVSLGSLNLASLFSALEIDCVFHLAGSASPSESTKDPGKYYRDNVTATQIVADAALIQNIPLVFASSCSVYGRSFDTQHDYSYFTAELVRPVSLYGYTKVICESMLKDYGRAYGLKSQSIRLFNVAGQHPSLNLRYQSPCKRIIPAIVESALKDFQLTVNGGGDLGSHPTADGTCVRDYIYVMDVCRILHDAGIFLTNQNKDQSPWIPPAPIDAGRCVGVSIKELINIVSRKIGGIDVSYKYCLESDPARVVSPHKIRSSGSLEHERLKDLDFIIDSEINYQKRF